MNDSDNSEDPQSLVHCPLNPDHCFPKFHLSRHLVKCRKQNEEKAKELQICPFNSTHYILRNKFADHVENCPDRGLLYMRTHTTEGAQNSVIEELNKNTMKKIDIACAENWDQDVRTEVNIIETCKRNALERGVLHSNSNKPPAERKALRSEQRTNAREKMNAEEEKKKLDMMYQNSSNGAEPVLSNRLGTSDESGNSFATAQGAVARSMNAISQQSSSGSTIRRGRGKNMPKMASTIGIGYGRGKP